MKKTIINTLYYLLYIPHIHFSRNIKVYLLLGFLLSGQLLFNDVYGQNIETKVTFELKNQSLETGLNKLGKASNLRISFVLSQVSRYDNITIEKGTRSIKETLNLLLSNTNLTYAVKDKSILIIAKKSESTQTNNTLEPIKPRILEGRIIETSGRPVAFVNVIVKEKNKGTITDADGNFSLENIVPEDVLNVSYIGYEKREIQVGNNVFITIVLNEKSTGLSEVIVTGYTSKKASEITGSVQQISGDMLRAGITTTDGLSALKGLVTGMYVVNSNANPATYATAQVRGQSTLLGGTDPLTGNFLPNNLQNGPLIVVDGVISNFANIAQVASMSDIESITVLRDAASTAIYGSKAGAGVIVVTTKKGKKGETKVSIETQLGFSTPNVLKDKFMTTDQWLDYTKQSVRYAYNYGEGATNIQKKYATEELYTQNRLAGLYNNFDLTQNYDWTNQSLQNGVTKGINATISGGNESTTWYFGVNSVGVDGNEPQDKYNRNSVRAKLDHNLTKFLVVGGNFSTIFENSTFNTQRYQNLGINYQPFNNPYDADGTIKTSLLSWTGPGKPVATKLISNPLYDGQYNDRKNKTNNFSGSLYGKLIFFPGLTFTSTNTWGVYNNNQNTILDRRTIQGSNPLYTANEGVLTIETNNVYSYLTSNVLNFRHTFGDIHGLNFVAGQEWGYKTIHPSYITRTNVLEGERDLSATSSSIYNGQEVSPVGITREKANFSLFSQADYNYNSTYLLSASWRNDATSNFSRNSRYHSFYSISAGWMVSQEKFWKSIKDVVPTLKLRASTGIAGKDAGADFLNYSLYKKSGSSTDYLGTEIGQGYYASQVANTDLTWEITKILSYGLDVSLLKNNRITFSFDGYRNNCVNLIQQTEVSSLKGVDLQYTNAAYLRNTGYEFSLATKNIESKDFNWQSHFTISHNKNNIISTVLPSDEKGYILSLGGYLRVDDDINTVRAIKYDGVDAQTGKPLFENVNEDGSITQVNSVAEAGESYQKIGSTSPTVYGGFTNNFSYKNWELSVVATYSFGAITTNPFVAQYDGTLFTTQNLLAPQWLTYWKNPGDIADLPSPRIDNPYGSYMLTNTSLYYQKADNVKIANLRLAYSFPKTLMEKLKIDGIKMYVSVDNVYTFTSSHYMGADPEQSQYQGNASGQGVTGISTSMFSSGVLGAPRQYITGLSINF